MDKFIERQILDGLVMSLTFARYHNPEKQSKVLDRVSKNIMSLKKDTASKRDR